MNNWHPHADYSHPNWTANTPSSPRLFVDLKEEKAPHWAIQTLIGLVAVVGFLAACYL